MLRKTIENTVKRVMRHNPIGILTDREIIRLCTDCTVPMIHPFSPTQVKTEKIIGGMDWDNSGIPQVLSERKIISYGTSSMGYDVRLANKFKIFTNVYGAVIDPLDMPEKAYVDYAGDYVVIPPNSYVLGHTIEYFAMPNDVAAMCVGKSTYARAGCAVNVTPIEPGFCGEVVIEVANQTNLPMKIYANMGISQFVFFRSATDCSVSYADRKGKYQYQTGIQTAKV